MEFSFQLYCARNFPPIESIFPKLKALGYNQVEGFGGLYGDAAGLAANLRNAGLTMPTAHFGLAQLKDTSTALKTAETLGIKTLFCPAIGKEERTGDDAKWVELGETLAALGESFTREGYDFGWHNHDFEFKPTASGRFPMDIILETATDIIWEVDVAWVVVGGQDPVVWFDKYGGRVTAIHVKDIAPAGEAADEDGWADVGHGTLDWQALQAAVKAKTRAEYYVMEHDNPNDVERFARRSIEAVRQWK
jgi:sugar phosphate isomerase/epimerase